MSLNKKDRSIYGCRSEVQKIYNQRNEIKRLQQENDKLSKEVDMWFSKYNDECDKNEYLEYDNKKLLNQQKEFIKYLEDEKARLVRECSNIYEDGLGKTKFVNEDIFDEVNEILSKYKEIIGDVEDEK